MSHSECPSADRLASLEDAMTTLVTELRSHMEREERLMEGQATKLAFQLRELAKMDHGDHAAAFAEIRYTLNDVDKMLVSNAKNITKVKWITVIMFTLSVVGHYLLEWM